VTAYAETGLAEVTVVLVASPGPLSLFKGWSGACSRSQLCKVKIAGPPSASALFGQRGGN
jgi:hypothetical protein